MVKTDSGRPRFRKFLTSPRLEELHAECIATKRGFGNRLTEIVSRYDALMAHYNPRDQFTDSEWQQLLAILHEQWPQADKASTSVHHFYELLRQVGAQVLADKVLFLGPGPAETTALIEQAYKDLTTKLEDEK